MSLCEQEKSGSCRHEMINREKVNLKCIVVWRYNLSRIWKNSLRKYFLFAFCSYQGELEWMLFWFEILLVTGRTSAIHRQIFVYFFSVEMLHEKYLSSEKGMQIVTTWVLKKNTGKLYLSAGKGK